VVSSEEADRVISGGELFHRAWQGSPANHNKHDSAYLGTGEGNHVYGYGHYFSDLMGIGDWYKEEYQEKLYSYKGKGKYRDLDLKIFLEDEGFSDKDVRTVSDLLFRYNKNIDRVKSEINTIGNKKQIEIINQIGIVNDKTLYEVELAPNKNEYLDWDKLLIEQDDNIKIKVEKIKKFLGESLIGQLTIDLDKYEHELTGEDLYKAIRRKKQNDAKKASAYLKSIGIRGIRYKAAQGKIDANNYVIFSDSDIKIIAKYSKNGKVQAFYNPANDTTYFVADNIDKNKDLLGLAAHELGVHALQLGKDDKNFKAILSEVDRMIASNSSKAIRTALARAKEANTKPEHVTEEVLAYLVENHPRLTLVQKFLNWFRNKLRAIGKALPPVQRVEWFRKVTSIQESDLVGMAVSALRNAPTDLFFDSVGRSDETIKLAQQQGYKGNDKGESEEWLRAVAKGLDMSQEARMARAKAMGFDTEEMFVHESPEKEIKEISNNRINRFGGAIFALPEGKDNAGYHANKHSFIVKNGIANDDDLVDFVDDNYNKFVSFINESSDSELSDDAIDAAFSIIAKEDFSPIYDGDEELLNELSNVFGDTDLGDSFFYENQQKLRGELAIWLKVFSIHFL